MMRRRRHFEIWRGTAGDCPFVWSSSLDKDICLLSPSPFPINPLICRRHAVTNHGVYGEKGKWRIGRPIPLGDSPFCGRQRHSAFRVRLKTKVP